MSRMVAGSAARASSTDSRPVLRPIPRSSVRDACTVCGATARTTILGADVIAEHLAWLEGFHRRRLKPSVRRTRDALKDRARFTQDEPRAIVGCRACGLVFRHPRRDPDAVERDYARDRYGAARLAALFASQGGMYEGKVAAHNNDHKG